MVPAWAARVAAEAAASTDSEGAFDWDEDDTADMVGDALVALWTNTVAIVQCPSAWPTYLAATAAGRRAAPLLSLVFSVVAAIMAIPPFSARPTPPPLPPRRAAPPPPLPPRRSVGAVAGIVAGDEDDEEDDEGSLSDCDFDDDHGDAGADSGAGSAPPSPLSATSAAAAAGARRQRPYYWPDGVPVKYSEYALLRGLAQLPILAPRALLPWLVPTVQLALGLTVFGLNSVATAVKLAAILLPAGVDTRIPRPYRHTSAKRFL